MFACEKLNMHVNQCIYSPDTDMTQAPKALKYKVLPDNVAWQLRVFLANVSKVKRQCVAHIYSPDEVFASLFT